MRIKSVHVCAVFILACFNEIWTQGLELPTTIPEHLLSCYRNRPPVLPKTMDTLIEIIRKIEMHPTVQMDIRTLCNSLLHKFRVDGIERDPNVSQNMFGVVPYRISGFQAYRQMILLKYLIPDTAVYFPINIILTEIEKCNLHWLLSSTVDAWERGDESRTCPQSNIGYMYSPPQRFGSKLSTCPEELGVVYQEHGALSPGTVIAAIAAGLSPMQLKQSLVPLPYGQDSNRQIGWQVDNPVNNTHAATFAGDLAEVIQFQAVNVKDIYLGPSGRWNDTYIPTAYYFSDLDYNRIEKKTWEISDAEIVGGIDGLTINSQIMSLSNKFTNLKLSQVLEMYYSDRGLVGDANLRACNRERNAINFLNREKHILKKEVENFARFLASNVPKYTTDDNFIVSAAHQTMDKFTPYLYNVMSKSRCVTRMINTEKIDLNVIIDQTWTSYNTLQIIMFLSRACDVSLFGSRMTVINGERGSMIVNAAQNTTAVYLNWKTSPIGPYELNLADSLLTLKAKIENSIDSNKTLAKYKSESHIALIIGYSSTINNNEHSRAQSIISSIKSLSPDLRFVYVTSRVNSYRFVQLTALPASQDDKIVVIDNVGNLQSFLSQIQEPLSQVPRSLIPPYCKGKKQPTQIVYEEYVTPGQPIKYRIHPDYLCGSSLQVKIVNWAYGELHVCMSRNEIAGGTAPQCKTVKANDEGTFDIAKPCEITKKEKLQADSKQQWASSCRPIYFYISAQYSSQKCSDDECRYPDQVKFNIHILGLNCIEPYKTICSSAIIFSPDYFILVFSVILAIIYHVV